MVGRIGRAEDLMKKENSIFRSKVREVNDQLRVQDGREPMVQFDLEDAIGLSVVNNTFDVSDLFDPVPWGDD